MAVRTDVSIDWSQSPRIITVAAPSTNISVQDLVDTLRDAEDQLEAGIQYDQIISAAGKEELGGGVLVGITATLLNALLEFEARPGPTHVQCEVDGGNLVAVDAAGTAQDTPISPTAFTQVVVTASSSATLAESEAIQFASYEGHVVVASTSGTSGTTYPYGTRQQPVDTVADALTVAAEIGVNTLLFTEDYTFDGTEDVQSYKLEGDDPNVTLTAHVAMSSTGTQFKSVTLTGSLPNAKQFQRCRIDNLVGTVGGSQKVSFYECEFEDGGMTWPSGHTGLVTLKDCYSSTETATTPFLDLNGADAPISVKGHYGDLEFKNITQGQDIDIDMDTGKLTFASTCTSGNVTIKGVYSKTDSSSLTITEPGQRVDGASMSKLIASRMV